ncbi:MAG: hypothetical protein IJ701_00980, partial [Bacteroidales bacterium]|nr:hypothetical protein [Bacteroidales bacterium]
CDRQSLDPCLKAIERILGRICSAPLSERALKGARKQLLGQLAVASDNGEAQCLSMGKSLLSYGRVSSSSETRAQIEAVTPEALRDMACRLFSPGKVSKLIYL